MAQTLNGNYRPNDLASYAQDVSVLRKSIGNYNFTDDTGAQAAYTIFTVTGDVRVSVIGVCKVPCTGAGTIELGVAGGTAEIIAQATAADLILNELWHDATPTTTRELIDPTGREWIMSGGQDVIFTVAGAVLTAGDIDFYALWYPLSIDGNVLAV